MNSLLTASSYFVNYTHPHRSKMQPMPKSLVLQGFFGFLGQFFDLSFFATFSEPSGLEPTTFSHI